jgi:glycosyltransferase involved in cell wall biosynthesis
LRVLVTIFEELVPVSGGGTPRISNIIKALVRREHKVYVASSIGVRKEDAIDRLGCVDLVPLLKVSRLSSNKMVKYLYAHPLNIWRVVKYARKIKPDLIISHNTIAGFAAFLAKRFQKDCLVVLDLTDLLFEYLEDYYLGRWLRLVQLEGKRLERKTIRESSKIVTISESMRDILLAYGARLENIELICDGVDTNIFQYTDEKELRNKFGKNADNVIILQGVIDPQDNPEIILHAAREVLKKHRQTMFWIIGNGTALPNLRQKVTEEYLARNFYFSGWVKQEEVARYISASDIGLVVLPDSLSARGRVTLKEFEYWACGVPVIAPQLPALEEVVEEGKTGFFYQPDDFESLAQKIMLLIENKDIRKKMGQRGIKVVKEKFQWQKLTNHYVKICEDFQRSLSR